MKLNLGSSDGHVPGFVNVDIVPPADQIADLTEHWPWATGTVEYIRAHDIIEHLPDKIHTMNEAYRVLQVDGVFDIAVPTTDGRGAFQDPQHISFWNRNSFFYYTAGIPERERFGDAYGVVARFEVISERTELLPNDVVKLYIQLKKV